MMKTHWCAVPVVAVLCAAPLAAQQPIDRTIPTTAGGTLTVHNTAGEVRVVGWDRDEIRVTGTLGEGAERLEVGGTRESPEIRVVLPRRARNVKGSDLEIRVPSRKAVSLHTVSADVHVEQLRAPVTTRTTSGDVQISGEIPEVVAASTSGDVVVDARGARRVEARSTSGDVRVARPARELINVESTSGDVEVLGGAPEVRARTVSGDLQVRNVSGKLSLHTVSGDAAVAGGRLQYGALESVSGNLTFAGGLERSGALNVQSHSGTVDLVLPADVAAEFEVDTFSGEIDTDFGVQPQRTSRYGPGMELRFSHGGGGAVVAVETFSGSVNLRRR